jgi:hypothetical protein
MQESVKSIHAEVGPSEYRHVVHSNQPGSTARLACGGVHAGTGEEYSGRRVLLQSNKQRARSGTTGLTGCLSKL